MKTLTSYFFDETNHSWQSGIFKRTLYCIIFIKCIYWLFSYEVLFGDHSIVYRVPASIGNPGDLAFFIYNHPQIQTYWFIAGVMVLAALNFFRMQAWIVSDLLLWLLVMNLHNCIYTAITGGEYLLNQFLFFNCLVLQKTAKNAIQKVLHNTGVVAVMAQVCLIYLISALTKLNDPLWRSGEALDLITSIKQYSLFPALTVPSFILKIATWFVILYQLVFPVVIFTRFKKIMVITGVAMHLYIAIGMGLTTFGLVMLAGYIFFWPLKR